MGLKMIIMDMDGTLLNEQGVITKRTKEALMKAQQQGVVLVLASGRSWKTLYSFGEELEMPKYNGWFIGANGAAITETKTMEHTRIAQIQPSEIAEIAHIATPFEVEMMGVLDGMLYDYIPQSLHDLKAAYRKENNIADDVPWTGGTFKLVTDQRKGYDPIITVSSMNEVNEPVNKMTFCHTAEHLNTLYPVLVEKLGDRFNFVRTTPQWTECVPKAVSKGNAIRLLQEQLGIKKEETIIFGDGENDLSMFDTGWSVAMGNAMESVKAVADEITADNNSDGIADVLEKRL